MVYAYYSSRRGDKMREDGGQISRARTDIQHTRARVEEREQRTAS